MHSPLYLRKKTSFSAVSNRPLCSRAPEFGTALCNATIPATMQASNLSFCLQM